MIRTVDSRLLHCGFNAGAPVVPVALAGTAALPRRARLTVRFGAPLHCTGLPGDARARRAATDTIMDAVAALSGQERVPRYNTVQ